MLWPCLVGAVLSRPGTAPLRDRLKTVFRSASQFEEWDYDTLYEVEIDNVAMRSGETRHFSYRVFIEHGDIEVQRSTSPTRFLLGTAILRSEEAGMPRGD